MREKIVYTDGNKVTVTAYSLRVGKRLYPFEDITKYGINKIRPNRIPAIALMILGAAVAAVPFVEVIPANALYWLPAEVTVYNYSFSQSDVVTGTGIVLFALALTSLFALRTRYGVRVVNGVGDINAVVTRRKKHAEQIVDAIGEGIHLKRMEAKLEEGARKVRREIV